MLDLLMRGVEMGSHVEVVVQVESNSLSKDLPTGPALLCGLTQGGDKASCVLTPARSAL